MLGLIYKDIKQLKSYIGCAISFIVFGLFFILVSVINKETVNFFHIAGFIFTFVGIDLLFLQNIFLTDENPVQKNFFSCSPLGIKGYVREKYLIVLISSVLFCAAALIINYSTMNLPKKADLGAYIVIATNFLIVKNAINLPFMARFGTKAGNIIKSSVFYIIIFVGIMYLLFGDLGSITSFDKFMGDLVDFFSNLKEELSSTKKLMLESVFIGIPIALALLFASYKICCKAFKEALDKYE